MYVFAMSLQRNRICFQSTRETIPRSDKSGHDTRLHIMQCAPSEKKKKEKKKEKKKKKKKEEEEDEKKCVCLFVGHRQRKARGSARS